MLSNIHSQRSGDEIQTDKKKLVTKYTMTQRNMCSYMVRPALISLSLGGNMRTHKTKSHQISAADSWIDESEKRKRFGCNWEKAKTTQNKKKKKKQKRRY